MLDYGTKKEQKKNNSGKEPIMTDFVRDLAAFASMSLFIASISVIALGL
ncbi:MULTISPECIES: hypothetical protein [unclassified Sinorhizobium]|nr:MULTISPECIES: hypothetical protein [unclassified Sinorhizobium]MDK1376204.1 hypothetical protein [Sinorhizobium sp. 6-70]MDK1479920.1 hypothetical protein [Sinorhizobium sp. 6-117]